MLVIYNYVSFHRGLIYLYNLVKYGITLKMTFKVFKVLYCERIVKLAERMVRYQLLFPYVGVLFVR